MANPKRASMREGPLAALFRKTEGEDGEPAGGTGPRPSRRPRPAAEARPPRPEPVADAPTRARAACRTPP